MISGTIVTNSFEQNSKFNIPVNLFYNDDFKSFISNILKEFIKNYAYSVSVCGDDHHYQIFYYNDEFNENILITTIVANLDEKVELRMHDNSYTLLFNSNIIRKSNELYYQKKR